MQRPQVKMVEDWARRIGAEVSLTYTCAVTHIIVQLDEENCAQRTLKFLYGVASGKWIVGVDWVHQCIREKRLIDEDLLKRSTWMARMALAEPGRQVRGSSCLQISNSAVKSLLLTCLLIN